MSQKLLIGTRKGLLTVTRGHGWRIAETKFLGDPVTAVLSDSRTESIYAALNLGHFGGKLWRTRGANQNWQECATPAYPPVTNTNDTANTASLNQIWCLEAGKNQPGVLWAGTIPGGFRSGDHGDSWALVQALWDRPERREWVGGGYDAPGIHSICINPRDPEHVTVAVSCGGVWATVDGGANWKLCAHGMRAAYMPPERAHDPNIQDPHRMVQCPADPRVLWVQHHNGIFRSTDGSQSWHEIETAKPSAFGFAVAVHPAQPDTAWFVPGVKDECRVPVDGALVVSRTRDGGKSFDVLRSGLPQENSYDLVYRHALDVDSSGECLAFGSTTGNLWVSENQGDHWNCISTHLPPINCLRFV